MPGPNIGCATASRFGNTFRRRRQVKEHKLPPELQGGRLVDGPLAFGFPAALFSRISSFFHSGPPLPARPFPFAANAKELKQQYYVRIVTPADRRVDLA